MDNNRQPESRPIRMDEVQRIIGSMMLEIEMLRRENMELREALAKSQEQPA
jgi:regulator of replication initiation timing